MFFEISVKGVLMFEIKMDNAKYWRDCLEAIVSLVDEGAFAIAKEGISLKAMDPSGISMVAFHISSSAFSKYEISDNASVGLNLENLSKVMSRTRESEALMMKDSESKLHMEFIGDNSRRRYRIPLIEVRKNIEKEPNVEFDATVEVTGDPLKDIIKDANQISSYISFKAMKNQFIISAYGDSGELEEIHESEGSVIKKIDAAKSAEATFNLEYLDNMVRACPMGNTIKLAIKTNEPLRLSYNIKDASITYYLAPYMES
jgi:proliferating cell nuclear antigen